jgi:hypothetical protein
MKNIFKTIASSILIFNGATAIYAGWMLITNPDGDRINLPLDYIKHSPFHNYFVPGILLLTLNGLFSIFTFICTIANIKGYSLLILLQGAILTLWIVILVIIVRDINLKYVIFWLAGQMMIIIGWGLAKSNNYFVVKQHPLYNNASNLHQDTISTSAAS